MSEGGAAGGGVCLDEERSVERSEWSEWEGVAREMDRASIIAS